MSEENIENITKWNNNFTPTFADHHLLAEINFNGHCLTKHNISIPKKVINLYISYTLNLQLRNLNKDCTFGNCFFGSAKLTKNVDLDKYKYSSYSIGFDPPSEFSLHDNSIGNNANIFGVDMSSSVHIGNNGKDTLILWQGPTQGLDDTALTGESIYPINFI